MDKVLRKTQESRLPGVYSYLPYDVKGLFKVTKWDLTKGKVSQYTYTDTTVWNALNKYYKDNSYAALSEDYDSSFVFRLFKWERDSIGDECLIPKNSEVNKIQFSGMGRDSILQRK